MDKNDPKHKIEATKFKDGAVSIVEEDDPRNHFVYLYPEQAKKLIKWLKE